MRAGRPLVTYFVQSGVGGPIKIGVTTNIQNRLQSLATGSAEPLTLLGTLKGNHERRLHERFAACRKSGEWFEPAAELLAELSTADHPAVTKAPCPAAAKKTRKKKAKLARKRGRWIPARPDSPAGSLAHSIMDTVISTSLGARPAATVPMPASPPHDLRLKLRR